MKPILVTERLRLETVDETMAEKLYDFVMRNKEFLREWEVERHPDYYTVEGQMQIIAADRLSMENGQLSKFAIFTRDADRLIGTVSLSNIVRGAFQSCHLGYRLDGSETNRGSMTEAVQAVVEYAFQELRLHRIEANIMPRNAASLKVADKLGFTVEGLARKYLKINGVWEDHLHAVLLNEQME
jgi:[ribosomal protein S5]-alanine N-acetyltransferase